MLESILIRFSKGKEKNIKIMLDVAYGVLKLRDINWEIYNELLFVIEKNLQNYDGRYKTYLEHYYNKIKNKESLKIITF